MLEKQREARLQQVRNVVGEDVYLFSEGLGGALVNNMSLGIIPPGHESHPAFFYGQQFGNGVSMFLGAAEFLVGGGMMGGGIALMVTSDGVLVPVGEPISNSGVAVASHGVVVMGKAIMEFKGKDGGEKWSSRNEPYTNRKAKSTVQKNYEDMKADLARYKAEHGNKCDKQKLEWFKKQLKHWKKKADATGETHSRKGKG